MHAVAESKKNFKLYLQSTPQITVSKFTTIKLFLNGADRLLLNIQCPAPLISSSLSFSPNQAAQHFAL
jgi:hypothetical protein